MALQHSPSIVTDGLVLCLDAANPKSYPGSGTAWFDLSGRGNHGTLQNGPTFNANLGSGSFVLDGTNDFINGSFSCNNTFYSLDWWQYPFTASNYNNYIQFDPADGNGWGSFLFHYNGTGDGSDRYISVGTDTTTRMHPAGQGSGVYPAISLNQWQHYAWSFNNGVAVLYWNGSIAQTKSMNISANSTFTGWNISRPGSGQQVNGYVSNFRVYSNKVLTATEVSQNFNALRGRFGI